MSLQDFGKRLGISPSTASDIEKSEKDGSITLERLRKAARALNCEVQVYFVPVKSLEETVRERAMEVARRRLARSNRSMALEAQEVAGPEFDAMVKDLADEILATGTKRLWTDEN